MPSKSTIPVNLGGTYSMSKDCFCPHALDLTFFLVCLYKGDTSSQTGHFSLYSHLEFHNSKEDLGAKVRAGPQRMSMK